MPSRWRWYVTSVSWKRQVPALVILVVALSAVAALWVGRLRGPDPWSGWLIAVTVVVIGWTGLRVAIWVEAAKKPPEPPQQPVAPGGQWRSRAIEAALLWGALGGAFFAMRACGLELGRLDVTEGPAELQLEVDAGAEISFWNDLYLTTEAFIRSKPLDSYPHLFDYDIEVRKGDALLKRLRCNPWRTFISSNTSGSHHVSFDGPIRGCEVTVKDGGAITIRAHVVEVKRDPGWTVERLVLIPKI